MNQPYADAVKFCEDNGLDFGELLAIHLLHGWVWSGPDYFAMVRPCHTIAPQLYCDPGEGDSVCVTLLTGNMARCLEHNRGISPTLTFQRIAKGRLSYRTHPYAELERIANHGKRRRTSTT